MTVVSSTKTKPPIMADVLRRQTDDFVELDDLRELIGRPHRDDDGNDDYGDDDYDDDDDDGAVILDDRRRS